MICMYGLRCAHKTGASLARNTTGSSSSFQGLVSDRQHERHAASPVLGKTWANVE